MTRTFFDAAMRQRAERDYHSLLLQAGDASRGAYSLESLIQETQHQIILQGAGLAKSAYAASAAGPATKASPSS
jgi:hypothetical protein